ncbi:hypothetical protein Aduo_006069 [Ancylostoma duodenale]
MTSLKIFLLFAVIVCAVASVAEEFTDEEIEPVRVKRQWGWGHGFQEFGHGWGWGRPWGLGGFYGGWGYPYGYGGFWG